MLPFLIHSFFVVKMPLKKVKLVKKQGRLYNLLITHQMEGDKRNECACQKKSKAGDEKAL